MGDGEPEKVVLLLALLLVLDWGAECGAERMGARPSAFIRLKISVLRRQPRLPILEKRVFWRERKVRRPWKTLV